MDKQRLEILKKQYEPLASSPVLNLITEVERLEKLACAWKASAKRQRSMVERWMLRAYDVQATVYVDNQMRWKPILQREEEYQAQQRAEIERLQAELKLSKSIQDDTPLTYNIMAPEIIDIALKYPHIYKHSYQLEIKCQELEAKFNQLMEFCLAAGLTPEWVEK